MRRIIVAGGIGLALGLFLLNAPGRVAPEAVAANRDAHAGHRHGAAVDEAHEKGLEALFDEPGEHKEVADAGADDGHAPSEISPDPHARHGDEDEHDHAHAAGDGLCPEHRVPEAVDALCQAGHIGDLLPGEGMKVRLAAEDAAAKAGVRTSSPRQMALADGAGLHGRIVFNRERLASITPLTSGVIRQVHAQPGDAVQPGEVLIEIAMPELAGIQADFIASRAQLEQLEAAYQRERELLDRGITSRQEFQQAEAAFREARSRVEKFRNQLANHGLTGADLKTLVASGRPTAAVALRAPFGGVIIDLQSATGEAVNAGTLLMTVADLDPLWLELSIPESGIFQAEAGASIQARFDGLPGQIFAGRIFQVGAVVDEKTRTLKALAEIPNPGHRLRVGMFGSARILSSEAVARLMVPQDAVQSIDGQPYVFIQDEPDLFELRRVETGASQEGFLAIVAGLAPGEPVVSGQGFALKSEVLKARLGASCADH